jgi:hypothetical protein
MGCVITLIGVIVPRLLILAGWAGDPARWGSAFGSPIWPILGFLFVPWTTFFFVLFEPNGFGVFELVVLVCAVLADVGTWGGGLFGNRKRISNFRDL